MPLVLQYLATGNFWKFVFTVSFLPITGPFPGWGGTMHICFVSCLSAISSVLFWVDGSHSQWPHFLILVKKRFSMLEKFFWSRIQSEYPVVLKGLLGVLLQSWSSQGLYFLLCFHAIVLKIFHSTPMPPPPPFPNSFLASPPPSPLWVEGRASVGSSDEKRRTLSVVWNQCSQHCQTGTRYFLVPV